MGFRDAENYRRRENREVFNQLFLRTPELDKICQPHTFFLIGEKGTGKTAYAVYLSCVGYNNTIGTHKFIRETEYLKFVELKKDKKLSLSDYVSIWKVIIYVLLAQQISEKEPSIIYKASSNFFALRDAINQFYDNAFAPEIQAAIQFAEEAGAAANLISSYLELGGMVKRSRSSSESTYQVNLMYIQKNFEEAFRSIKLSKSQILFIDGIDIRPPSVDYESYLDCIKGLANAVWSVNNDIFANIKDSKGRLKIVLLVRPDIFTSLSLQNMNSKVGDNSVVLSWVTTYKDYRTSPLFLLTDRLLSYQQDKKYSPGIAWDHYFPYDAKSVITKIPYPSSFIQFLRYCLYRPRNIVKILQIQQENIIESGRGRNTFSYDDFSNPAFTRKYSDYILGEVKDHISFYYDSRDYESLLKFFQYLNGKSIFSYVEFLNAFKNYHAFLKRNSIQVPVFCDKPDIFLQFLYDLNILGYIVDTNDRNNRQFFSWCNRDRSLSNIAPKVRTNVTYEVHYGLMKALDLGLQFKIQDSEEWDNSNLSG